MADATPDKKIPPLRQVPVVFLDVETTGLDPTAHEIVEIAVVSLEGQPLIDTKVKPQNIAAASPKALEVNGYNEADWADAPTFDEIKDDVMEALKHKVIVGQNPQFDRNFVVEALRRAGVDEPHRKLKRHTIDTITLAWEHLVPCGLDRLNLGAECEFLGIPLEAHRALADAQGCRTVYLMTLRATEEQRFAWRQRARQIGLIETPEPESKDEVAAS
jgi:DNA polymerase-3 subunit alpha (Gram-positive type)